MYYWVPLILSPLGRPHFFLLQKFNSQKKTSHEQAIVLGDGSRVDNLFEGHKMLSDSSIKLIKIQRAHS